ncbi:hypothetical protein RCL1_006564 [Eukaryota sp. TZLM3-RCL]
MSTPNRISELEDLEKRSRLSEDRESTQQHALELLTLYRQIDEDRALSVLHNLVKKRLQQAETVTALIRLVLTWADDYPLESTSSLPKREAILKAVRDAAMGKITVEREYALSVRELAKLYESRSDLTLASLEIRNLAPEQIGSLSRSERIEMILYQVRLLLDTGDLIRSEISIRRITPRSLHHEEVPPTLHVLYYYLASKIFNLRGNILKASSAYLDLWIASRKVEGDHELREHISTALSDAARYCLLSELGPERTTLAAKIMIEYSKLEDKPIPEADLLQKTLETLLIEMEHGDSLPACEVTEKYVPNWRSVLKERIVDHNLFIVSKFFSTVQLSRLAELVQAQQDVAETRLCALFERNILFCKIDRQTGSVSLRREQDPVNTSNDWAFGLMRTIDKLEKAVHLIEVERSFSGFNE